MMLKQLFLITVLVMYMALSVGVVHGEVSTVNQYDLNGNLVSGDGKFYEYNDANKLVKVRENDQSGRVIAEYFYDFAGQRVKKVENGVTTYYIGKHYETNVVEGKAENSSYFFANGERVAKKDVIGTYFYHLDHLGGVNAVTNAAGTVIAKTSYLPFGEIREGGQEKFSFTGKEMDKATDLYYFDARFNSPGLRHFTQADSANSDLSDPQDLNKYAYVGNNPLSFVDPDGHKKKKKAKLSKREKWMIEHGVDPDHDKTSLKSAKKQEKEGKKYTVAAAVTSSESGGPIGDRTSSVGAGTAKEGRVLGASTQTNTSNQDGVVSLAIETVSHMGLASYLWSIMGEPGGALAGAVFTIKSYGYDIPNAIVDIAETTAPIAKDVQSGECRTQFCGNQRGNGMTYKSALEYLLTK